MSLITQMGSHAHFQVVKLDSYKKKVEDNFVIIPTSWLDTSVDGKTLITRYIEPSEALDDKKFIEEFVQKRVYPVPQDWPTYICNVQKEARKLYNLYNL